MRRAFQIAVVVTLAGLLVASGMRVTGLPRHLRHSVSRHISGSIAPSSADFPDFHRSLIALWALTLVLICVILPSLARGHRPRPAYFAEFVRPPPSF